MFSKSLMLVSLILTSACSSSPKQTAKMANSDGQVLTSTGTQTFHASYTGKEKLQIGDKFNIIEYQPISEDLRVRESRNLPFMADEKTKRIIGQATVSRILNNNVYEFKTDQPQHVPQNALIQKL